MCTILNKNADKIIPNITDTYYMGDLLWVNTPNSVEDSFVFKQKHAFLRPNQNIEKINDNINKINYLKSLYLKAL